MIRKILALLFIVIVSLSAEEEADKKRYHRGFSFDFGLASGIGGYSYPFDKYQNSFTPSVGVSYWENLGESIIFEGSMKFVKVNTNFLFPEIEYQSYIPSSKIDFIELLTTLKAKFIIHESSGGNIFYCGLIGGVGYKEVEWNIHSRVANGNDYLFSLLHGFSISYQITFAKGGYIAIRYNDLYLSPFEISRSYEQYDNEYGEYIDIQDYKMGDYGNFEISLGFMF